MRVYIFDLVGKLAHWRKFYTNSSSLTYYFPTRTNVIGILASILEMPRDSYYEIFSPENLRVGISLRSKLRKKIFVVNYINTKTFKDNTQIKLELLLPRDFSTNIKYRIFLSAINEETHSLLEKVKKKILMRNIGYGVYLGQRAFRGDIVFIDEIYGDSIEMIKECKEVCSIIFKDNIKGTLDLTNLEKLYVKEKVPLHFNDKREIERTGEIIGEINKGILSIKDGTLRNCVKLKYQDKEETISFV